MARSLVSSFGWFCARSTALDPTFGSKPFMVRAEEGPWLTYGYFQTCAIVSSDARTKVARTFIFSFRHIHIDVCCEVAVGVSGRYFVRLPVEVGFSAVLCGMAASSRASDACSVGLDVGMREIAVSSHQGSCLGFGICRFSK